VHKRWKYENELKYSPKTESRDREIEFAFTCNSGCYAPFPDAGSLPLFSCGNEASMCVWIRRRLKPLNFRLLRFYGFWLGRKYLLLFF
jgi:hypothetical protein